MYPLDAVYESAGVAVPVAREIAPDDIPHPYRGLLSHRSDMTQTLERHYGGRINIRALSTSHRGRWYMRRVLLVQEYRAVRWRWARSGSRWMSSASACAPRS